MKAVSGKMRLIIITCLLLVVSLGGGCASGWDFDNQLSLLVKPYRFSIVGWELDILSGGEKQPGLSQEGKVEDESNSVIGYFFLVECINALKSEIKAINTGGRQGDLASLEAELNILAGQKEDMEDVVGRIIKKQIEETLAQQGIFNPVDKYIGLRVGFPPVNFKFGELPYLLVVSPRGRIESIREVALRQNLNLEEIEDIEAEVDKLDVSSLVVEIGGFGGTYPTFVADDASLRFTLETVTHEWLHQYLIFKPLGFLYLLDLVGVSRNYDIATMNETVAGMVSKEIGTIIHEKYYSQYESDESQPRETESEFNFNREMREIRRAVHKYLAQGEIEQAEEFMEQKRRYLSAKGYYIRKLNQAYFAFHGTYADRPTSINPIGIELKALRNQSVSLKDFLDTVAEMTSRQELIGSIK